jgi:hypothetical protein
MPAPDTPLGTHRPTGGLDRFARRAAVAERIHPVGCGWLAGGAPGRALCTRATKAAISSGVQRGFRRLTLLPWPGASAGPGPARSEPPAPPPCARLFCPGGLPGPARRPAAAACGSGSDSGWSRRRFAGRPPLSRCGPSHCGPSHCAAPAAAAASSASCQAVPASGAAAPPPPPSRGSPAAGALSASGSGSSQASPPATSAGGVSGCAAGSAAAGPPPLARGTAESLGRLRGGACGPCGGAAPPPLPPPPPPLPLGACRSRVGRRRGPRQVALLRGRPLPG